MDEEEVAEMKAMIQKLKFENESNQQELYELRRKLRSTEAMQRELQELNETLERESSQKQKEISNLEWQLYAMKDKLHVTEFDSAGCIADLENQLVTLRSENEKLQHLAEQNRILSLENAMIESAEPIETALAPLRRQIEELTTVLTIEREARMMHEEAVKALQEENTRTKEILEHETKIRRECEATLESMRDELAVKRLELETVKGAAASGTSKGNSLFAEVEDRRKVLVDKMKLMQSKYNDMKQLYARQANEIIELRAENTMLKNMEKSKELKLSTANAELLEMYKNRIIELETKLKSEKKCTKEITIPESADDVVKYLHIVIAEKKKEIEELQQKIENMSIQSLTRAEAMLRVQKDVQYWEEVAKRTETEVAVLRKTLSELRVGVNAEANKTENLENNSRGSKVIAETLQLPPSVPEEITQTMDLKTLKFGKLSCNERKASKGKRAEDSNSPDISLKDVSSTNVKTDRDDDKLKDR